MICSETEPNYLLSWSGSRKDEKVQLSIIVLQSKYHAKRIFQTCSIPRSLNTWYLSTGNWIIIYLEALCWILSVNMSTIALIASTRTAWAWQKYIYVQEPNVVGHWELRVLKHPTNKRSIAELNFAPMASFVPQAIVKTNNGKKRLEMEGTSFCKWLRTDKNEVFGKSKVCEEFCLSSLSVTGYSRDKGLCDIFRMQWALLQVHNEHQKLDTSQLHF